MIIFGCIDAVKFINLKTADLDYNSNRNVDLMNQTPTNEKNDRLMKARDVTRR